MGQHKHRVPLHQMGQDQAGCNVGKNQIVILKTEHGWGVLNPDCEAQLEAALSNAFNQGVYWQTHQLASSLQPQRVEMKPGKIYFISYGGSTELVVRYSHTDTTEHHYHSMIHYWNGRATYNKSDYSVNSGITEIREASQQEKLELCRLDIEHNNI